LALRATKPRPKTSELSVGGEIIEGLRQVYDTLKKGVPLEQRFTVHNVALTELEPPRYTARQLQRIRASMNNASQPVFAKVLGVSVKTLQAWERGTKIPLFARRMLQMIERDARPWAALIPPVFTTTTPKPRYRKAG